MTKMMKISIAKDTRPNLGGKVPATLDIVKILTSEEFSDVRVLNIFRNGHYLSLEAPYARYFDIKSAIGTGYIITPQFNMNPL